MQVPGSAAAGSIVIPYDKAKKETWFEADESLDAGDIPIEDINIGTINQGRQKGKKIQGIKGRYIRANLPQKGETASDIAVDATLRAAALRSSRPDSGVSSFTVLPGDILKHLPTGGATPFADGLMKAWQIVKSERIKNPSIDPLLVFISDGEANIPLRQESGALDELYYLAGQIRKDGLKSLVIDTSGYNLKSDRMRVITNLSADYYRIDRLRTNDILGCVRVNRAAEDAS
jgi:Mg-chelatase subunit ChlD